MSDPFLPKNTEAQLAREAKMGLSLVFLVIGSVGAWCYFQYTSFSHQIPLHIQNAPIAQHIGPDEYLKHLNGPMVVDTDPRTQPNRVTSMAHSEIAQPSAQNSGDLQPARFSNSNSTANANTGRGLISYVPNPIETPTARDVSASATMPVSEVSLEDKLAGLNPSNFKKQPVERLSSKALPPVSPAKTLNDLETSFSSPVSTNISDANVKPVGFEESSENQFQPTQPVTKKTQPSKRQFTAPPSSLQLQPALSLPLKDISEIEAPVENLPGSQTTDEQLSLEVIDPIEPTEPKATQFLEQPAAVPTKNNTEYISQSGDSLWSISQSVYGDGRYFRALYEYNRATVGSSETIPVGMRFELPKLATLASMFPKLCPSDGNLLPSHLEKRGEYTTEAGDTLFDIARQATGQASRYLELIELNEKLLPASVTHLTPLRANIVLLLPE